MKGVKNLVIFLFILGGLSLYAKPQSEQLASVVEQLKALQQAGTRLSVVLQPLDPMSPSLIEFGQDQWIPSASIAKLFTTYAVLNILGPDYQFKTVAFFDHQKLQSGVLEVPLTIKGYGDPFLVSERLWMFAEKIKGYGLKVLKQGIVIDQSYFVDYPQFVLKKSTENRDPYLSPLAPTSLNFNAEVIFRVSGRAPLQKETYEYQATPQPSLYFGRMLSQLLQGMGLQVMGNVREREPGQTMEKAGGTSILFESLPLSDLVKSANKYSNNFMTDMLVFALGVDEKTNTASYERGRQKILSWLATQGLEQPDQYFQVGSGLSLQNQVRASVLIQLLQHAWKNVRIGPEFFASLPRSGADGTLQGLRRLSDVRAKTGSLAHVCNLVGILHGQSGTPYFVVFLSADSKKTAGELQKVRDSVLQNLVQKL